MTDYQLTAAPIVKEFLNYHEVIKGHSAHTVDAYYVDIKCFLGWLHHQERPNDESALNDESITLEQLKAITKTDIYEYMAWLQRSQGCEKASVNRKISALKSFYRYLTVEMEYFDRNPLFGISTPKLSKKLPIFLNTEQAEQLLAAPNGTYELRDTTILLLFMTCGLRISELVGLNLDDVTKEYVKVTGKGDKERIVYLSDAMRKQMRKYLDMRYRLAPKEGHEKALFLSRVNQRFSVRGVRAMVDKKLAVAGLSSKSYSPHKLRHTAATMLLQNGIDVRVLQEILGHQRLDTTQIYTHVEATDLRIAAKASHLGENLNKDKGD